MFIRPKFAFGEIYTGSTAVLVLLSAHRNQRAHIPEPSYLIITPGARAFSYKVPSYGTAFLFIFRTQIQSQNLGTG